MIEKLRECFDEMVVYKDLKKTNFISTLSLPSFLRDWLLKKFADDEGNVDVEEIKEFVQEYIPNKDDWQSIKDRIVNKYEQVKFLTKITVDINISKQEISFSLPDFGLSNKDTIIEPHVWDQYDKDLVNGQEVWGIVELGYIPPFEKQPGKIRLTNFTSFQPYDIDVEYFKDARAEFTTEEWIDVILGAIDYNADGYKDEFEKRAVLARLLTFVEKKLNIIELAPKGTGKSYLFGHVSKYGLLTDGGKVTRAKMFYDTARRTPGFITGNDFVAIDEVKLVTFGDVNEMRSIMQGYMEYGMFNIGGYEGQSDAGIVFLGNIDVSNMDEYANMFTELPTLFQESALVDRIHGFIKGWDIPRMNDDLKISGWALNSEYFCTILHLLRDDASYRAIVDQIVEVPPRSDTRDTEAVKRICTAYLKLLFPHVRRATDVDLREFQKYCLRPAVSMRGIIKRQMGILDEEFRGKNLPKYMVREPQTELKDSNSETAGVISAEHSFEPVDTIIEIETDERYQPINELREARFAIPDEGINKRIENLEGLVQKIIDRDISKPEEHENLEKFLDHYLPITINVLNKYKDMYRQDITEDDENRMQIDIHDLLDTANDAFTRLLHDQYEGDLLDAATDISALKIQLTMDGLLEKDE